MSDRPTTHRATRPRRTAATWPPTSTRRALTLDVLTAIGAGLAVALMTLSVALLAAAMVTT